MNILKYATKTILTAGIVVTLSAAPSFATLAQCVGEGTDYPNLSTTQDETYPVRCQQAKDVDTGEYITFYGKTSADCAQAGVIANDPDRCATASVGSGDDASNPATAEEDPNDPDGEDATTGDEDEEKAADTTGPSENDNKKDDGIALPLIIGIIVAVVIIIAVIVLIIVKKKGNKDQTPTPAPVSPATPTDPSIAPTDAPTAPETPAMPEVTAAPEAPETPAAPEAPETPAAPEAPETPETPEEPKPEDNPFGTPAA